MQRKKARFWKCLEKTALTLDGVMDVHEPATGPLTARSRERR
jgi:hypothetical protein